MRISDWSSDVCSSDLMSYGNGEVFNLDDYGIAKNEDGGYRMDASATGMGATALKLAKAMEDEGWGEKEQVKAFMADLHKSPERRKDEAFRERYEKRNYGERRALRQRIESGQPAFEDAE